MKLLRLSLIVILALSPSVAWAANANGGNGNAYGHDNGNNGNADGASQGGGNNGGGPGGGAGSRSGGAVTPAPDQNQALDALGAGALPLSEIASRAIAQWGGRVIDANLVRQNGALAYRLTILSDQGVRRRVFYDATTGAPLEGS